MVEQFSFNGLTSTEPKASWLQAELGSTSITCELISASGTLHYILRQEFESHS